ncbi:hypothetical protein Dimus_014663 [Dionaea muscipula]
MDLMAAVMVSEMDGQKATRAQSNGANFFLDKPISEYDLKNLWQHVIRVRKIIAKDKAEKAAAAYNVERESREKEYSQLRIIEDAAAAGPPPRQNQNQNPPNNDDPQMNDNHMHLLLSDPKGKRKLVIYGDHDPDPDPDPDYYKGKEELTTHQRRHASNERAATEAVLRDVDNNMIICAPEDPNASTGGGGGGGGLQVIGTGPSGLLAQINQAREAYRGANTILDKSLLSNCRDFSEFHGGNDDDGVFTMTTDSLEIGDWSMNSRFPPPGLSSSSSGELLNEAYHQLLGSIPSSNINSLLAQGNGINIQFTKLQWNGGENQMAEINPQNPIFGFESLLDPTINQTYEHLTTTGNQFLTALETYAPSSSIPNASSNNINPTAGNGLIQISGFSSGFLDLERIPMGLLPIDLNPLSQITSATASLTVVPQGQPSANDVADMQVFQGLEDLNDLSNDQPTRFITTPNLDNLDKFDEFNPDELFGQLQGGGATSRNDNFDS